MTKSVGVTIILLISAALAVVDAEVSASEMASIDYEAMIGGPLTAVIKAQAMAAQSTADFIKSVGLDENNNVVNIDFDYEAVNTTTGEKYTNTLTIAECTIEFNAKLTSVKTTAVNFAAGLEVRGDAKAEGVEVDISASFSTQVSRNSTDREQREFSMTIVVQAEQGDIPAGLARVLSILEDASRLEILE